MEPMTEEKQNGNRGRNKLYFSVFILDLVFFASGCAFSWSSPTLPKLMSNSTDLSIDTNKASWIVSLLSLGNMLGPFIAGFLLDAIGRKWTLFLDIMCKFFSWIVISQTFSIYMLYVGRFFLGVSVGISFSALPLYIAEISEDSVRGLLNNLMQIFIPLSILLTYSIGPLVSYNGLIIFCCIPCVLFLLFFTWLPESPYYLISKKKTVSALATVEWLREGRSQSCIEMEIKNIQTEISEAVARKSSFKNLILHAGTLRALLITSGLLAFQQFTGIGVVIFYTEPIFRMTESSISSYYCAIIVGTVMLVTGSFGPLIIARFGYKKTLLVSGLGMAIAHAILGVYLTLHLQNFETIKTLNWIPILGVNMFIIFSTIGFSSIPWAMMGELFSPDMKTIGAAVDTSICAFFTFTLSNIFPNIVSLLGINIVFFMFSLFSVMSVVFVIYVVPNTSGMSLPEIQELMNYSGDNVKKTGRPN